MTMAGRQAGRQTGRQADRQAGRRAHRAPRETRMRGAGRAVRGCARAALLWPAFGLQRGYRGVLGGFAICMVGLG